MRIGVDFDGVLFDTESFKQELEERLPRFGNTYVRAKEDGVYDPEAHARVMGVDRREIDEAVAQASRFLLPGVGKLESIRHEVFIVSRGDPEFQKRKIGESGALEYVDGCEIVVSRDKDDGTGIDALVDDTREELERTSLDPARTFHFSQDADNLEKVVRWADEL